MMKIGGKEAKSLNKLGKFMCFLFVTAFFCLYSQPNARALDISVSTPENPIIEISLSAAQLNLDLTPKADSPTFGTADLTVTAGTNNLTGYSLSMQVADSALTRTTELESHPINAPTIPSLAVRQEGYTESSFTRNHWGYKLSSDTNYLAIPESLALSSSSEPTNGDPTTITFASKIDMSLPAGSYSTDINFVAVSNAPIPTLQDINTWKGSLITNRATLATDSRDGKYYHVAKLADNEIWLLDNLELDLTDSATLNNVTTTNTNASATTLGYLKNGGGTTSDQYATASVSSSWSANSYSAPLVNMDSKDVVPSNAPTNGKGYNKVGGYYNFCAASAGSYCYGNGASAGTSSGNATEDICPKNWRIPTGNTVGEYGTLANQIYGSTGETSDAIQIANYRNTLSLPLSGGFYNGLANNQGSNGLFWSSTRSLDSQMYDLYINADGIYPFGSNNRFNGYSVRCIAKPPQTQPQPQETIVTFDANGGEGTMNQQVFPDDGEYLWANEFTRYDSENDITYYFIGWNTAADGSGTSYEDEAEYTSNESVTLYAQWAMDIIYYDTYRCEEDTQNKGHGLVFDTRNNRTYTVKYINDRCWMTQNLVLEPGTVLTSDNSNLSSEYTIPDNEFEGAQDDYSEGQIQISDDDSEGAWYNYCLISAGTACDGLSLKDNNIDICPLYWRIPDAETEIIPMIDSSEEFSPTFNGYYSNGALSSYGDFGVWWSNNPYYALSIGQSSSDLMEFGPSFGAAVRCIMK